MARNGIVLDDSEYKNAIDICSTLLSSDQQQLRLSMRQNARVTVQARFRATESAEKLLCGWQNALAPQPLAPEHVETLVGVSESEPQSAAVTT